MWLHGKLIGVVSALTMMAGCASAPIGGIYGAPAKVPETSYFLAADLEKSPTQYAAGLIAACAAHLHRHPDLSNFDDTPLRAARVRATGGEKTYIFGPGDEGAKLTLKIARKSCHARVAGEHAGLAFSTLAFFFKPMGGTVGDVVLPDGTRGGWIETGRERYFWWSRPATLPPGDVLAAGGPGTVIGLEHGDAFTARYQ